jgi:hypothetical protein
MKQIVALQHLFMKHDIYKSMNPEPILVVYRGFLVVFGQWEDDDYTVSTKEELETVYATLVIDI